MAMPRYGGEHQALRRAGLPLAYGQRCVRCGRPMLPGQPLDLDHRDDGNGYAGWSHAHCNRSAGARMGNARRNRARREGRRRMLLTPCTLGIEIAEDRSRMSIAAAGYIDGAAVLVELAAYLEGTDPTAAVLRLQAERTVPAVVVDPRSPAATTIELLTDAGVRVTELSTHDLAVAHGQFLDTLAAGRLKHAGQLELTAAVRHGTQRPLGGADAWQRRGTAVDVSPLAAATLAVWALQRRPALPRIF